MFGRRNQVKAHWQVEAAVLLLLIGVTHVGCGGKAGSASEASLLELDRAWQTGAMAKGKSPNYLEELTELLTLQGKRLPTPPPGKKIVINCTNHNPEISHGA